MASEKEKLQIAIPIFDRMTALDAIGPYEVLGFLPQVSIVFVSDKPGVYFAGGKNNKLGLTATASYDQVQSPDIILVPGGPPDALPLNNEHLLGWIRKVHPHTKYTTSVCTGALLLGAAGVLKGIKAITHWASYEALESYGAIVSKTEERYGKIISAAGVSAGVDMGLYLASVLSDNETAQAAQLMVEYDPKPPFDAGSVEKAGPLILAKAKSILLERQKLNS